MRENSERGGGGRTGERIGEEGRGRKERWGEEGVGRGEGEGREGRRRKGGGEKAIEDRGRKEGRKRDICK